MTLSTHKSDEKIREWKKHLTENREKKLQK